jgi:hypothetical protein
MMTNNQPAGEAELAEATFTDASGREWRAVLSFIKVRKIRAATKVDLGNVEQLSKGWAQLLYDDDKALDAVWIAIADGDDLAAGVTKDEWLAAMDGPILEDARRALKEAVENFTPPPKRSILRKGLAAVDKAWRIALGETEQKVDREVEGAIERAMQQTFGTHAPRSPASSASSTTNGRSAKRTRQ